MNCEKLSSCKDCIELALKVIFVAVFVWGVMSLVCCSKSCSSQSSCCKTSVVKTTCGPNCVKPCCSK
jgi:hypothetical protein